MTGVFATHFSHLQLHSVFGCAECVGQYCRVVFMLCKTIVVSQFTNTLYGHFHKYRYLDCFSLSTVSFLVSERQLLTVLELPVRTERHFCRAFFRAFVCACVFRLS